MRGVYPIEVEKTLATTPTWRRPRSAWTTNSTASRLAAFVVASPPSARKPQAYLKQPGQPQVPRDIAVLDELLRGVPARSAHQLQSRVGS